MIETMVLPTHNNSALINPSRSLEDFTNLFSEALAGEQDSQWKAGEIVNLALASAGNATGRKLSRAETSAIFKAFAVASRCSAMRVKQLAVVAQAFESGMRDKLPSWSHYRAARQAALRLGVMPADVLAEAELNDWGLRDISRQGRKQSDTLQFHGTCVNCEARVSVSLKKTVSHGEDVYVVCPLGCGSHAATGNTKRIGRLE